MVDLEADDALASAARIAAVEKAVQKVCIWTPDKDLAQCVRGDEIVQVDRRTKTIRNAAGVREKFGVEPRLIPDFLALVGDAADGYPGWQGSGEQPRHASSIDTAPSKSSRLPCWGNNESWHCCLRIWLRSGQTPNSSTPSTN